MTKWNSRDRLAPNYMYFNSVELNAGFDQFRVLISTLFKRFSVNTSCVDWIIIYIIIYYLL